MKRFRVPLWTLMLFVVLISFGFAALKNPTELMASCVYVLTVGLLLFALVGAIFRKGD